MQTNLSDCVSRKVTALKYLYFSQKQFNFNDLEQNLKVTIVSFYKLYTQQQFQNNCYFGESQTKVCFQCFQTFFEVFLCNACNSLAVLLWGQWYFQEASNILCVIYSPREGSHVGSSREIQEATAVSLPSRLIWLEVCGMNIVLTYLHSA